MAGQQSVGLVVGFVRGGASFLVLAVSACGAPSPTVSEVTDLAVSGDAAGPSGDAAGPSGDAAGPPVDQRVDLATPPACDDGRKNGDETDVDCGGACMARCGDGQGCAVAADCKSGVCSANRCQPATCKDGVKNGGETDIDCGGACPNGCADGLICQGGADCSSGVCAAMHCQKPGCLDGVKNGDETDLDCGGSCPGCAAGKKCLMNADCLSKSCAMGMCVLPPPAISKVDPAQAGVRAATPIVISGSGFVMGAAVTIGGMAVAVGMLAPNQINAVAPALPAGNYDLVVTNPDKQSAKTAFVVGGFKNFDLQTGLVSQPGNGFSDVVWSSAADLNNDKKLDLVLARTGGNGGATATMLGNGDGTFKRVGDVLAGGGPFCTGDIDGDTKVDFVEAGDIANGSVNIYPGKGDGTFGNKVELFAAIDENFRAVGVGACAIGDLNRDGIVDLALAGSQFNTRKPYLVVYMGLGNGLFAAGAATPMWAGGASGDARSIALVDLDRDGNLDGALYAGGSALFALGVGNGTFKKLADVPLPGAVGIAVADFTGDKILDLAGVAGPVQVFKGDGKGAFAFLANIKVPDVYPSFGRCVVTGDFDGDKNSDLAVVATYGAQILLQRNGALVLQAAAYGAMAVPRQLLAFDADNDGNVDLLTTHFGTQVLTMRGTGDGRFLAESMFANHPATRLQSIDFTGDQRPELVALSRTGFDVVEARGNGTLAPLSSTVVMTGLITGVALGDLDGDGNADLCLPGMNQGAFYWGNGKGGFSAPTTSFQVGALTTQITAADVNGDGKPDLAGVTGPKLTTWLGDGKGNFGMAKNVTAGATVASTLASGDFDGDGHVDFVTALTQSQQVVVFWGDGANGFKAVAYPFTNMTPAVVAAGDLNNDGADDMVVGDGGAAIGVFVANGKGKQGFAAMQPYFPIGPPHNVTLGDLDGDGNLDVVTPSQDTLSVFLGKGDGTLAAPLMFFIPGTGQDTALTDFDGDGKPDVVMGGDLGALAVLRNLSR